MYIFTNAHFIFIAVPEFNGWGMYLCYLFMLFIYVIYVCYLCMLFFGSDTAADIDIEMSRLFSHHFNSFYLSSLKLKNFM